MKKTRLDPHQRFNPSSSEELGRYLEAFRRWRKFSQSSLAEDSGSSLRHFGRFLRGQDSPVNSDVLIRACSALDLELQIVSPERTPWDGEREDERPWASSERTDWAVHRDLVDWFEAELGCDVTLDACASSDNAHRKKWIGADEDCRKLSWAKKAFPCAAWMNPPFGSDIESFLQAAHCNAVSDDWIVGVFLPLRPSTQWWGNWVEDVANKVWPMEGRVKLECPGRTNTSSCPFEPCIAIYEPSRPIFRTEYLRKSQPEGWSGWRSHAA